MNPAKTPLAIRSLNATMLSRCEICGRQRGGNNAISHVKCSKIRAEKYRQEAEKNA